MINVFGSSVGEEELAEIRTSLGWMGMGKKVKQFEDCLTKHLDLPLVMVDSGSNALYLALKVLNLPLGSKVILPSFTWVSCASAILLAGLTPLFADVDLHTQNITNLPFDSSVSAILVVHYAGLPVDIKQFRHFDVPIIEDAAHAIDSKIDGISCGSFGDISIFSFDAVKNLATPEGGAVASKDDRLLSLAREHRYCGIDKSGYASEKEKWWEYDIKHISPKMLPNDISASIGLVQLRKLDSLQKRRKEIWYRYQKEFAKLNICRPVDAAENEQHSYFTYFVRLENRDLVANRLLENGIYTTLRYHPLHLNSIYRSKDRLPVSELLNKTGLNLPLHPGLSDNDVEKVIANVYNAVLQ